MDTDDVGGLIAPRPLMLEMGTADSCFYFQDMWKGYLHVREIYEAAGASDRLWTDIHEGSHAFSGRRAEAFFEHFL